MSSAGALRRLPTLLIAQNCHRASAAAYVAASSRLFATGFGDQRHAGQQQSGVLGIAATLLGVGAVATVTSAADAPKTIEVTADPYARPSDAHPLPSKITLYQYEVCPYCCKVRAFLDYHKLPYTVIEVNPLTKGELKWSSYKKVPVVQLDEEIIADSSAIMSRLATDIAAARPPPAAPAAPAAAPAPAAAAEPVKRATGGGFWSFWGGSSSSKSADVGQAKDQAPVPAAPVAAAAVQRKGKEEEAEAVRAEEVRWRKWVDDKLVKVLTANIYRSWDESVETFKYITDQTGWSWGAREVARWAGAIMMWQVGKRMPAKYGIDGDLRTALYDTANDFADNAVRGRRFAGGDAPNLADLSAFGVIRAVRKTPAFRDLMANSRLGPWFAAMEEAVGGSARINPGPGDAAAKA